MMHDKQKNMKTIDRTNYTTNDFQSTSDANSSMNMKPINIESLYTYHY
jgi:hypothetical protein